MIDDAMGGGVTGGDRAAALSGDDLAAGDLESRDRGGEFSLRLDGSAPVRRGRPAVAVEAAEAAGAATHVLSVLVPARDEAENLPGCLASLLAQSEPGFLLGEHWHLWVIDDGSADETFAVAERAAEGRAGVHVVRAPVLEVPRHGRGRTGGGMTGKCAALWFGVNQGFGAHLTSGYGVAARGAKWLLFTDADTLHEPGMVHRAVVEAERHGLGLLSYSPRQIAAGVVQRVVLPLVFSELASVYPPKAVSDPASPVAAANGQFLMVAREAYFAVGGHAAVGDRVLEDVALARLVKRRYPIRLRYAPEAVSARMYPTTGAMVAGWTKNLALLFGNPLLLAAARGLDFLLLVGLPLLPLLLHWLVVWQEAAIGVLWVRVALRYWGRVRRSGCSGGEVFLSVLGLPVFVLMLVLSWRRVVVLKEVVWKGRVYRP